MTIDRQVYELAYVRLTATGWHNTVDIQRLAEKIQSTIEEYMEELDDADRSTKSGA
jgi:hypothetical protein